MISVALTEIQHDFILTFAEVSWLISIFYLASAVGQPVMGKLGDMFGPKRLFLTGLFLVAVSCILAPFSPNLSFLLGCRALQAVGSSALFPSGMSIVRKYITEGQAKALAAISIFATTSAAFGPSVGGLLIASWSWPAIFLINFPFIVLSFVLAIFILPGTGKTKVDVGQIDFPGISFFTISIVGLILFLLSLEDGIRWWALIAFMVSAVCFYFYEIRQDNPFINLHSLKRNPNVSFIYLQFITINLVYYCYFFGFPTFLQQALGYNAKHTGLIMLALAGFGVLVAPIAGRLIDRYGSKLPLVMGAGTLLTGTALLLTFSESSPLVWLLAIMAILGVSNGFNNISMQTALFEQVKPEETGSASGLFQTSRYLGSILSSSLLGITFNRQIDFTHLHLVAVICVAFCGFLLFLALRLPGRMRAR
jgi:MFS family permease